MTKSQFSHLTIPKLVQQAALRFSKHTAIEEEDQVISYEELDEIRQQWAAAFIAAGVQHGDRIAIWAPNVREWIYAAIGAHSVGAMIVPVNTRMKGAEAGYVLRASGAKILCTVSGFLGFDYPSMLKDEELPGLAAIVMLRGQSIPVKQIACVSWQEFLGRGSNVHEHEIKHRTKAVKPDDVSDLIFTSGTTGKPKGVQTSHAQNLRVFEVWSELVGLQREDRYLIVNPFFHSFGYKAGWLAALIRGATILPMAVFDAEEIMSRIGKERISVLPGPPTLYQSILASPNFGKYDLSCLRLAVTGAAAIPVSLVHRMRNELHFKTVLTAYGLTETCGVVTMCREGDDPELIANTSGRAIPDVEVRCVNDKDEEVPRGSPGEIVVRGYNVMQGYFENPDATKETIDSEGWLHTGDVGVMDANGYLRITDRIKDMFIVGGFNVYPVEIEHLILTYKGVAQVAVIGLPDERMGEVAGACIVPMAGAQIDKDAFIAWCKQNMSNYKVPKRVEIMQALPMNATGKVQKFVLRDMLAKK
jgi:acyl-CoA synthetase (AMP-forming)/AMP-acid ligase II